MSTQVIDRELERLEGLWADGLGDAYRSYLGAAGDYEPVAQQKLALAAALVEIGVRLQSLGGLAAPPPTLLMGDLCLARSSRLLADAAPQQVQIAFASAIEVLASAAAAGEAAPAAREMLLQALGSGR
ncbi:MAG TPA: hypothetical protein VNF26_01515 [Candidatus Baltobacterales bacterium]|nr:hypothetical protein [Candidatus Baltobacterales bacterium]